MSLLSTFARVAARPDVQRTFWAVLRSWSPAVVIGKRVFVSRYAAVTDVLKRDQDFTIAEINGARMQDMYLSFFLGMDRGPAHDRELALMEGVVKREDLATIRRLVQAKAGQILQAARADGQLDIVTDYGRAVPLSLISDYFGIPVRDEERMRYWMRMLFHHLFLNLNNDPAVRDKAKAAAGELKAYMEAIIAERRQALTMRPGDDNVLNRLLQMQQEDRWVSDDVIRRNLCGLIAGSVDTTNKVLANVMEVLLQKKEYLAEARRLAVQNDMDTLGRYMLEVLRFNPHNPIVLRYCKKDAAIQYKGRSYRVPAGSTLFVGINSAMFDKAYYRAPDTIDTNRQVEYFHFSYGLHACFGRYINMVQIPELMAGLLRLDNLRAAPGEAGQIVPDGPFPDKFIVQFDR
jgi:cytochrome P450